MIRPGTDAHNRMITASKIPAILGISRYESPYRLWHCMKGLIPPEPPRDAFTAGHAMEHALAHIWREENPGWQLSPGEIQIIRDDLPFPAAATIDRRARRGSGRKRVVEFKTARSLEEWGDDFTDEAPADYLIQVQAQMHLTGYTDHPAHLMVMGPYFRWHTYQITYDAQLCEEIFRRAARFHASLLDDIPPPLDDRTETYQAIKALHPGIDGTTVDIDADLASEFLATTANAKAIDTHLRALRNQVLAAMGDAATATANGTTIAERRPHSRGSIALIAAKPTTRKEKNAA